MGYPIEPLDYRQRTNETELLVTVGEQQYDILCGLARVNGNSIRGELTAALLSSSEIPHLRAAGHKLIELSLNPMQAAMTLTSGGLAVPDWVIDSHLKTEQQKPGFADSVNRAIAETK